MCMDGRSEFWLGHLDIVRVALCRERFRFEPNLAWRCKRTAPSRFHLKKKDPDQRGRVGSSRF
jgi:hypothetical protein